MTRVDKKGDFSMLGTRVFDVIGVIVLIAAIAFSIYVEKGDKKK